MKKTDEYLKQAKDCRGLAKQMVGGAQRDQLMKMAETWEVLAAERERTLRTRGESQEEQGDSSTGIQHPAR
jgi:hypothetical protein